jgi:F-type H+-transporting ATPase subunit epsilon
MHQTGGLLRLRLTTPTRLLVDSEVVYVQAEDPSGRFGILPGHEPWLTILVPSVLVYRAREDGELRERYAAVRSGVLRVAKDLVQAAVRGAALGPDLGELRRKIMEDRRRLSERSYRSSRSLYQMQIAAWRSLMEFEDERIRS